MPVRTPPLVPRQSLTVERCLAAVCLAAVCLAGASACGVASDPADVPDALADVGDTALEKPTALIGGACDNGAGFVDWHSAEAKPAILRGIQGGQHIWVSARAKGVWPKKMRLAVTAYDAETGDLMKPGKVELTNSMKNDGPWLLYSGIPAFVKEPCKIKDRKLRIELVLSDLYGVQAKDEVFIRPTWDGFCEGDDPDAGSAPHEAGPCDAGGLPETVDDATPLDTFGPPEPDAQPPEPDAP